MKFKIKEEYLQEIKKKHNSLSLRKIMSADAAHKILHGDANISLQNYYKLCESMGWKFSDYIEIETKDSG